MRQNADSEFQWKPGDKGVTITRYRGKGGSVVIPDSIGGKPVVAIDNWVFSRCGEVTDVTVPYSVRQMGPWVFKNCGSLTQIEVDDRNPCSLPSAVVCAAGIVRNSYAARRGEAARCAFRPVSS